VLLALLPVSTTSLADFDLNTNWQV